MITFGLLSGSQVEIIDAGEQEAFLQAIKILCCQVPGDRFAQGLIRFKITSSEGIEKFYFANSVSWYSEENARFQTGKKCGWPKGKRRTR